MEHTLTVLLRRDPTRDRQENRIAFEGYEMLWPDGRPISVGFDAFCRQGQRLLGLGRYLAGCSERSSTTAPSAPLASAAALSAAGFIGDRPYTWSLKCSGVVESYASWSWTAAGAPITCIAA